MNRNLEFRPAARKEFDEAADWYEDQRPGLRAEFVRAVDKTGKCVDYLKHHRRTFDMNFWEG